MYFLDSEEKIKFSTHYVMKKLEYFINIVTVR